MPTMEEMARDAFSASSPAAQQTTKTTGQGENQEGDQPTAGGSGQGGSAGENINTSGSGSASEPVKPVEYNFEEELTKRSNGRFKTLGDLEKVTETRFADDLIKGANEYALKGGNYKEYLEIQSKNYSEMSDVDVVKLKMKLDKPHLSDEDIDALVSTTYSMDEDDYSSLQRNAGLARLKDDALATRSGLIDQQKALSVPPEDRKGAEAKLAIEKAQQSYVAAATEAVKNFKGLTFSVDKERTFNFGFTDESQRIAAQEKLTKQLTELDDYGVLGMMNTERYKGVEGLQRLTEDIYFLENKDAIIQAISNNERSVAIDDWTDKNLKHASRGATAGAGQNQVRDWKSQASKQMHSRLNS